MSNIAYIANRLVTKHGYDEATAAAYAGNFRQESGGNPNAWNAKEQAFGIAQWRHDRLANLRRIYGKNPTLDDQIDFSVWEASNTERAAHQKVLRARGVAAKTAAVDRHYERSAGTETNTRIKFAQEVLSTRGGYVPDMSLGSQSGSMVRENVPGTEWTAQDFAGSRPPYDTYDRQREPYQPLRESSYAPEYYAVRPQFNDGVDIPASIGKLGGNGAAMYNSHGAAFWEEFTNSAIWRIGNQHLYSPIFEGNTPGNFTGLTVDLQGGVGNVIQGWQPDKAYAFRGIEDGFEGENLFYLGNARNDRDYEWRRKQVHVHEERRRRLESYDGYANVAGALLSPDSLLTMLLPMSLAANTVRAGYGSLRAGLEAAAISAPAELILETQRARFPP